MEKTQVAEIYQNGELVASAPLCRSTTVSMEVNGNGPMDFQCFHLPKVELERTAIFQVLHRKPLKDIFSGGGILFEGEQVEPVYLVHGTVSTDRGNPEVTAVVLTKPSRPMKGRDLAANLPQLYKLFLASI